jgi:hypothetical protein
VFTNQLRFEGAVTIPRHLDRNRAVVGEHGQNRLEAVSISAAVTAFSALGLRAYGLLMLCAATRRMRAE